jgi:hypothetical protein
MNTTPHPETEPAPAFEPDEVQQIFVLVRCVVAAGVKRYRVLGDVQAAAQDILNRKNGVDAYGVAPVATVWGLSDDELPAQIKKMFPAKQRNAGKGDA